MTLAEGADLRKVEAAVQAELDALRATPPSEAEMQRLKNQFEYNFLTELESLQARAVRLNEYDAYTGSPDYLAQDLARFRAVSAASLSEATKTWLAADKMAKIVVLPKANEEASQ